VRLSEAQGGLWLACSMEASLALGLLLFTPRLAVHARVDVLLQEDLRELRQRWRILPAPEAPQNAPRQRGSGATAAVGEGATGMAGE
jgi:hypothetical protein